MDTQPTPPPPRPHHAPVFTQEPSRTARSRLVWMVVIVLCLLGLSYGCTRLVRSAMQTQEEAKSLLKELHLQMIRHDWDGIYAEAGPDYRNNITQEKSQAYFSAVVRKIGNPVSSESGGIQWNESDSGSFLRASFKTTFAQDATGVESILWKKVYGQYRMQSYTVDSAELVER